MRRYNGKFSFCEQNNDIRYFSLHSIAHCISLVIGAIFHSNQTILAYTFLYGGIAFLVSLVLLAVGAILGVRSGKLQRRKGKGN